MWTEDAGLPEPHVNRTVRTSSGRLVCVPDLFDEEAGLVVEYEGEEHRKIRRHASDAARHERCREVGLEYCMVTAPDMRRPDVVVRRLQAARARAAFTPVTERRWVVAPRDSVPLDEVLDSREDMARQLWQHRGVRILPW